MSQWITDRRPTIDDVDDFHGLCLVYNCKGKLEYYEAIADGEAWKPVPKCEPYVKPKRWEAKWNGTWWSLYYDGEWRECLTRFEKQNDAHRQAAERIAAIYEEVMP